MKNLLQVGSGRGLHIYVIWLSRHFDVVTSGDDVNLVDSEGNKNDVGGTSITGDAKIHRC